MVMKHLILHISQALVLTLLLIPVSVWGWTQHIRVHVGAVIQKMFLRQYIPSLVQLVFRFFPLFVSPCAWCEMLMKFLFGRFQGLSSKDTALCYWHEEATLKICKLQLKWDHFAGGWRCVLPQWFQILVKLVLVIWTIMKVNTYHMHYTYTLLLIEESLEVKLPRRWTDGKAEVGRVREEKRQIEKIREEKESEERRCRCAKR